MMDIRPTSDAAVDYVWFGRNCLEQARRSGFGGAKAIRDGRWLVICKYTLHHATLITLSQGDFTMHPRSGRLAKLPYWNTDYEKFTLAGINGGGWAQSGEGFSELAARSPYPLVDNDHGTFVVSIDGEDLEVEWADSASENYGNIWWSGTGDEPSVLSWKGPPSIQFPIGAEYTIPGLTMEVPSGNSVFGCFIYSDGAQLCHGPAWYPDEPERTLIVGACYATDEARKRWLVAMTVTHKGSAHVLQVWRSEDTGKTWQLLNEFPSLRAAVTAFISQDGRRFVYGGQLYQIDAAVSSVVAGAKIPTSTTGTRTIHGAGGYGSNYRYEGVRHIWPTLSKETGELAYTTVKEEAAFGGTGSGNAQNPTTEVPVYRGNPATGVTLSVGYSSGTFEFKAEAQGSYCSLNWSGVDRSNGVTAWKTPSSGCNSSFTVTVTLLPQGVSATYTRTAELNSMVLSGPAAASVGAQYTAQGAVGTVSWSIGSGSISSYGTITDTSGCGTTTITATDECGRSASLSVRLPTGVWVYDYTINYPGYVAYAGSETMEYAPDGSFMEYTVATTFEVAAIVYVMRYDSGVGCYQWSYYSSFACVNDFPVSVLSTKTYTRPETTISYNSCADGNPLVTVTIPATVCPYKVTRSVHYKWVCP